MPRRKRVMQPDSIALLPEEDALPEDLEIPESESQGTATAQMTLADELLFSALLRQAVMNHWPNDQIMADFVTYMAGPLSVRFGTRGAKGGDFVVRRREAGLTVKRL
jgi:hypothetical protein